MKATDNGLSRPSRLPRRAAAALVVLVPVLLAGGADAASAAGPTGSWGGAVAPSRQVSVTAGQKVRTSQLPATLRTASGVQAPRLVRDPAAYAAAKARPGGGGASRAAQVPAAAALAAAPAASGSPFTGAFFDSEGGSVVPPGQVTFTGVAFTGLRGGYPTFTVGTSGDPNAYDVWFAAPAGQALVPGVYEEAQRFDFRAAGHPGLEVFGQGSGCNTVAGRFVVDDATYDPTTGNVLTFSARFEHHCEGGNPALFGALSFNSTADYRTRAIGPNILSMSSRGHPASSSITVTNNGPAAIDPATPRIVGPNAADFGVSANTCSGAIAAGTTCTITVTYTPGAAATSQATLQYSDELAPLGSPNETAGAGTGRDIALIGTLASCNLSPQAGVSGVSQSIALEPPDTIVAVSQNHIVEMTNTTMLVIDRNTCSRTLTDLNTWFGIDTASPSSGGMTDPQVYFDPGSGRFFASAAHEILNGPFNITGGGVRLAVSGVDDPSTWTPFRVGEDSATNFLDQPKLGVTVGTAPNPNGWVVVTWNDFTVASGNFNGSTILALDKSAVIAAASGSTLSGAAFGPNTNLFGIVPARQSAPDADAFAVYNLGGVNFMGAIRWDGASFRFANPGMPITPTGLPPEALQPAGGTVIPGLCSSACLDTGDDRVESAVWGQGGVLWAGLTDACDPGGGVRSCVRIDQFQVTDSSFQTVRDGDLGLPGWDLFYPAVELDSSGNLVVGLNVSNASTVASIAVTGVLRNGASGSFAGVRIVHQGSAPYIGQRWGDYSGVAVDPANPGTVWVGDEESIPGGAGNWTTTLVPVSLGTATTTAPGTIAPPALDQLGCCLAAGSGPAISSWQPGRLDLFIRGTDNAVYHKWFSGSWSGFESQGGVTTDNPAAVSWGPNRIDLFVRGTDNQLYHKWFDGSWHGFEPLGGVLASAPTVSTWGPGRLDVFVRGTDNQLYHKWFDGSWHGFEPLGGTLTSAPGAVAWAPGRIDVVARDSGNGIQHKWFDGSWHPFESLGGASAGAPAISSWGPGHLDLWIQGPADNALYHKWYGPEPGVQPAASGWSQWTDEAESLAGPPGAVSWAAERQDVFWNGSDQNVHHTWAG